MKKKGLLFFIGCLLSLCACEIRGVPTIKNNYNNNNDVIDNSNEGNKEEGSNNNNEDIGEATDDFGSNAVKLSFKSAASFDYLKTLNNKQVTINGYMATSSPVDGSFIFLMNMPYQNCPFCKPNTSQLSNTLEAYPEKNEKFSYTSSAIKIVGTLIVAEDTSKPFTDPFGYEFVFKIINAEYKILKESDLSEELALWQKFANTTLITDLYQMFDYIDFVCKWPTYFVNSYTNADGETVPGFYLYPGDAINFIKKDGGQYNYGYKDGYFDKFINRINKISTTGFEKLITIINKAKELAAYALSELDEEHYTSEKKYVEKFGTEDYVFTLNDTTLSTKADDVYYEFADWLSSFEM
ncbi:MAG: hypothetical protein K6E21_06215 [Bacilli bacterium]|nr:hypothetical protein [Bacilli bacterium]